MTSMRSRSGPGTSNQSFAVAMKNTCERSNGTSRKWSVNSEFCSGSSTSSNAELGSPCGPAPSLSTSSMTSTGFAHSARRRASTMRPGMAPTYVRRCPRIVDSSRTPPTAMRSIGRPVARAIDCASEVLPVPGGPRKQMIGACVSGASARTARYSRMRCFGSASP